MTNPAADLAKKRWAKVSKVERSRHMKKMAKARWDKVRASASIDKPAVPSSNA